MTSPHRKSAKLGRHRTSVVLVTVALMSAFVAMAVAATTGNWTHSGGDAGYSGYQPVIEGSLPIGFKYRQTDTGALRTSAVISGGSDAATQRVAYGKFRDATTDENNLFIRRLDTGALLSTTDVTDGDEDPDAFGPAPGGVNPVSSSPQNGSGVLYLVHNDDDENAEVGFPSQAPPDLRDYSSDNDIALSYFNESTGAPIDKFAVGQTLGNPLDENPQVTAGYTIEAPPTLGPPAADESGARSIVFIAKGTSPDPPRLFRIPVDNASDPANVNTRTDDVAAKDIPGMDTKVPPVIAYLEDPSRPPGTEVPYVIISANGAGGSRLQSYKLADFDEGPSMPADIAGAIRAISVPVAENGLLPGQPLSDANKAPSVYAAFEQNANTIVRRFTQTGTSLALTDVATSGTLTGKPAPGLSVTAEVVEGVQETDRVIVATSANVFSLNSQTLVTQDRFRDGGVEDPELSGDLGFTKTAPSASGGLVYLTRDDGAQLVLHTTTVETAPNDPTGFQENIENNTSTLSIGRPALANGYSAFLSDRGLFVYRAALNPQVTITLPQPGVFVAGSSTPVQAKVTDPDGTITEVTFRIDGANPFLTKNAPDQNTTDTYSGTFNTTTVSDGTHTLTVTGKDNAGTFGSDSVTFVVNNFKDPSAALTVDPAEARPTGTLITLDASGSAPTPNENETIVGYRFDLDGNGTFEHDNQGQPKLATTFDTPGEHKVAVQVRDSHGDTAVATATVVASNRPPIPAFNAPAIVKPGATATFDASPSSDPDGTITLYEWDLDGNGDFETNTGTTPTVSRVYPTAGTVRIQLRVLDSNNAPATIAKDLVVGNINPVAAFIAIPTAANTGERVVFDATGSKDFDGGISRYQWDLDGNGSFEVDGGSNPRTSRVYTRAGVVNVKLRVTDTDGAASEVVRQITVITAPIVRRTPRRLSISLTPKTDLVAPYAFRARGTLTLPSGISKSAGCSGTVTITTKAGNRTISSRRVRLSKSCRYSKSVSFKDAKRFGRATALRVQATYGGNARLLRKRSARVSLRVKPATS